jgi:hypothetical protein
VRALAVLLALPLAGCAGGLFAGDESGGKTAGNAARTVGALFGPAGSVVGGVIGSIVEAAWAPATAGLGALFLAKRGSKKRHLAEQKRDFTAEEKAAIQYQVDVAVAKALAPKTPA